MFRGAARRDTVRSSPPDVQQALAAIEERAGVRAGFAVRAQVLEALETHVLDRLRFAEEQGQQPSEAEVLLARAAALGSRLEAANTRVVERLRHLVASGRATPERLLRALVRYAGPPGPAGAYDTLDVLVSGLLDGGVPDAPRVALGPEMVFYQPTPARSILALVERVALGPSDVLYDLGSGLGHVALLGALLSGARACGVEIEPAYCAYARETARRLRVKGVELVEGDLCNAPLAGGTVYYLYTPVRGALLVRVLARLREEASRRALRVCTLGPCTAEVAAAAPWLTPADGRVPGEHEVAVFASAPPARG